MIITRAPLRISLGGGGTDLPSYYRLYGGFILSAAIDKYVFIYLNRLMIEDFIRVKYSQTELVEQPLQINHPLLREALLLTGVDRGVEIASMADVPAGTGLGSSGSFLTALLLALHTLKREHISTAELAEEACAVEIERAAQPVGKHDQYLAAYGGLTCLEIAPSGHVEVAPLAVSQETLETLQNNILLFYTGIRRESFDILREQQLDSEAGVPEVLKSLHRTKELGHEIRRALLDGDADRFGELLDVHWQNKKQRSEKIADPQIDHWYALARSHGALGGKLMGAGGGGFFLFYAPHHRKAELRSVLTQDGLREMPFRFDFDGAKVLVNI